MIQAIVMELPKARQELTNLPAMETRGNPLRITGYHLTNAPRFGFNSETTAVEYAELACRSFPNKLYAVFTVTHILEAPPGKIIRKVYNAQGELINA